MTFIYYIVAGTSVLENYIRNRILTIFQTQRLVNTKYLYNSEESSFYDQ